MNDLALHNDITVLKCNHLGKEVFRYQGKVVERGENHIVLEARFGLEDISMGDIPLSVGDRFLETYYTDRWCNVYEIRARDDDRLKAWYCNIACPAEINTDQVTFRDLALDLLVYPDGRQVVLDEYEFAALQLSAQDKEQALSALEQLKREFKERFAAKK